MNPLILTFFKSLFFYRDTDAGKRIVLFNHFPTVSCFPFLFEMHSSLRGRSLEDFSVHKEKHARALEAR